MPCSSRTLIFITRWAHSVQHLFTVFFYFVRCCAFIYGGGSTITSFLYHNLHTHNFPFHLLSFIKVCFESWSFSLIVCVSLIMLEWWWCWRWWWLRRRQKELRWNMKKKPEENEEMSDFTSCENWVCHKRKSRFQVQKSLQQALLILYLWWCTLMAVAVVVAAMVILAGRLNLFLLWYNFFSFFFFFFFFFCLFTLFIKEWMVNIAHVHLAFSFPFFSDMTWLSLYIFLFFSFLFLPCAFLYLQANPANQKPT